MLTLQATRSSVCKVYLALSIVCKAVWLCSVCPTPLSLLHRLLHIPRESVPVIPFKRQYQWNQMPPQYLIHPEQRGIIGDASFLPLHPGVTLTGPHSSCSQLPPPTHKMAEHIAELHRLANQ